jgi:hypothetical protein
VASLPRGSGIPKAEPAPTGPAPPEPPAAPAEHEVPVTPATRREVNAVLTAFVRHAVAREDPEQAWPLATPALKAGSTRSEWAQGDLPVYPFPARSEEASGWYVIESFENDLLLTLVMHSRPKTKRGAIAFQVELKRLGEGKDRRWLVESFIPERVYAAPATEKKKPGVTPQTTNAKPKYPGARLSPLWFIVPGVLLSLIVLVPLTIVLVSWRRGVRAEKAYLQSLESRDAEGRTRTS